ncbi:DegV family protein [Bellilinea caldifistulae]|nr:DegV family protein [Bellilinea caldifistulae]
MKKITSSNGVNAMQIVTDRGCDLSPQQLEGLPPIHYVPMKLTLAGKTYSSGEDLSSEEFYRLLEETGEYPTTSQAGTGDFVELYRRLAQDDPEILSIHISSGLSGTLNSARVAAGMVPESNVTIWDTMTLSAPEGWQVEAAARAIKAGWELKEIIALLEKVRNLTVGFFTLDTMKYLVHGGRISHLKGLLASLLNIRPVISVSKEDGRYVTMAQERTFRRAIQRMAQEVIKAYPQSRKLRLQLIHGHNPAGIELLREAMENLVECEWLPPVTVGAVLGAHTGSSLVGICAGPAELADLLP